MSKHLDKTENTVDGDVIVISDDDDDDNDDCTFVAEFQSSSIDSVDSQNANTNSSNIFDKQIVRHKCIPEDLAINVDGIESYIGGSHDIDSMEQCNAINNIADMLLHRCQEHSAHRTIFLQIEERAQFRVLKIVRCEWRCRNCNARFNTPSKLNHHFVLQHPNHWLAAKILIISNVIKSNDPKQSIQVESEHIVYFLHSAFVCNRTGCKREIGTRTQAIEHHNQHHYDYGDNVNRFEFTCREKIVKDSAPEIASYQHEINEPHPMHLFDCLHCKKLFGSPAFAIQHHFSKHCRYQKDVMEPRFRMKKLLRCPVDDVIRTYDGMKSHYADKHPGKQCTPVNIFMPKNVCGLCDYNYKNSYDLDFHYGEKHACGSDSYGNKLLKTLKLHKFTVNECKYATGCCGNEEKNQLNQIVAHLMECERRFVCKQCPDRKFPSRSSFVSHYEEHDANANNVKIVDELQNFKIFNPLFNTMQIIMPNGLVLLKADISGTTFVKDIHSEIGQNIRKLWDKEKDDIDRETMVRSKNFNFIISFCYFCFCFGHLHRSITNTQKMIYRTTKFISIQFEFSWKTQHV